MLMAAAIAFMLEGVNTAQLAKGWIDQRRRGVASAGR
jgi:hypothetical protein